MPRLPNPRHHVTQRSWEFEARNERNRDEVYYITEQIGPGDKYQILDVHGYSSRPGEKHIRKILDAFKRAVG
jgi:hypothetical protein